MAFSCYYDSNDTGLGGVTNTAGSQVAFLDKVLINGYNAKTLTSLTSVGSLVTATLVSHGYRDLQFVTITGATPAAYNGTFQIIAGSTTINTFQYTALSSPGSPATGTLGCIVAPLSGWTNPFTGTNLRAYQAGTGNKMFLYVDDTGTTSARWTGFEKMTDITFTYALNPFPLTAQLSGGIFVGKASTGATRRTILWGNGTTIYYFNDYAGDSSTGNLAMFGDGVSFKTGDAYLSVLIGSSTLAATDPWNQFGPTNNGTSFTTIAGHFIARSFTQQPGSVVASKVADFRFNNLGSSGAAVPVGGPTFGFTYPAPIDGNMWVSPIYLSEITIGPGPRGTLPGISAPLHNRPLSTYTIFTGAGSSAGKTYMLIYGATGCVLAEISNTW